MCCRRTPPRAHRVTRPADCGGAGDDDDERREIGGPASGAEQGVRWHEQIIFLQGGT